MLNVVARSKAGSHVDSEVDLGAEDTPKRSLHDQRDQEALEELPADPVVSVVVSAADSTVGEAAVGLEGASKTVEVTEAGEAVSAIRVVEALHQEVAMEEIVVGMEAQMVTGLLQTLLLVQAAVAVATPVGMAEVATVAHQTAMALHQWVYQHQLEVGMTHVAAAHMMTDPVVIAAAREDIADENHGEVVAAIWSR